MNIFQHVSEPAIRINDQVFVGPVEIIGSPVYGRMLFRDHAVVIQHSQFIGDLSRPLLTISADGCEVSNCTFRRADRDSQEREQ